MNKKILFFCLLLILTIPAFTKPKQEQATDQVIVIYNADKSVSVIYPAPEAQKSKENYQDFLMRIYQRSVSSDTSLNGLPHEIISSSVLPSREFRDAWEGLPGRGVYVNQVKAQEIERERIRQQLLEEEKDKLLEEQAIESLKQQGKWE